MDLESTLEQFLSSFDEAEITVNATKYKEDGSVDKKLELTMNLEDMD